MDTDDEPVGRALTRRDVVRLLALGIAGVMVGEAGTTFVLTGRKPLPQRREDAKELPLAVRMMSGFSC
jgi:hypothetical protein